MVRHPLVYNLCRQLVKLYSMQITEDIVNKHNEDTVQQFMDAINYFSTRIDSVLYYEEDPIEWQHRTVISIHSVENNDTPKDHVGGFFDDSLSHHSGEKLILSELVSLSLTGLYKKNYEIRSFCSTSMSLPEVVNGKNVSHVYIILTLEYINDSFPLHEKAVRSLKRQLKEFLIGIGLPIPQNLLES